MDDWTLPIKYAKNIGKKSAFQVRSTVVVPANNLRAWE